MNLRVNDLLVNVLPPHKRSSDLVPVGIRHEEAPKYFESQDFTEAERIISEIMAEKPLFAITSFQVPYLNVPEQRLKQFVKFSKQYPNLYFYAFRDPSDPQSFFRHPILKNLNLLFIPLCVDRNPGDNRVRRLILSYTFDGKPFQPLFHLLRQYGIDRRSSEIRGFSSADGSRQAFLRYRGREAYLSTDLTKYQKNPNIGRGKIVVFGAADINDDNRDDYAFSVYTGLYETSMQQISLALDTMIMKDPLNPTLKPAKTVISVAFFIFYFVGVFFLSPLWASVWGFVTLLIWTAATFADFIFFDQFLFFVQGALGIGLIHFFAMPAFVFRHLREQDRMRAARDREAEVNRIRSQLVVRSARADLGLKIATQVAHDIRSPLSAMSIALQKRQIQDGDEADQLLKSSIERVRSIADDLLKKFLGGEFYDRSAPVTVNIRELLEQLLAAYRQSWPTVNFKLDAEFPIFVTVKDRALIERAFANLINNAVEALSNQANGEVLVQLHNTDSFVDIHLIDNGPGVPEHFRSRIFDRGATFGKPNGTGLGLAQARESIESVGGTADLLDSARGAHFHLRIPKPQAAQQTIQIHKKVILVEDNEDILKAWAARLNTLGAEVTLCSSPEQFSAAQLSPLTTVITDLIFENSEQTGFEVIERARSQNCLVILCTSLGENHEIRNMSRGLADLVITKNQLEIAKVEVRHSSP